MSRTPRQTIQFALLVLVVFISSLLIKPIHILLAHHTSEIELCTHHHDVAFTADHHKDCPICDFEFCTFIPQKQTNIPSVHFIVRNEQTHPTVACLATISSHLFQLRAPPAL